MASSKGSVSPSVTPAIRERIESGRARRDAVPIESHAQVPRRDDRTDPIAILRAQDADRVVDLVPIRHARMRVTPFTFFRGGAAIMAADLASTASTDLRVQLCGDAHLSNFGVFNSPDRRLVFDLNDFDETSPGPFEWDLKRLAASITVAGRNNELEAADIRSATRAAIAGYRRVLGTTLTRSPLEIRYQRIEIEALLAEDERLRRRNAKALAKATRKDSMHALDKLTEVVDGRRRIIPRPPLIVPLAEAGGVDDPDQIRDFFERYRATLPPHRAALLERFRIVDIARKVVGVGSVGTRCHIVLMQSDHGAPLFLQFKEATTSVLEPHAGPCGYGHHGERVVRGQQLLQSASDILLGWSSFTGPDGRSFDFYFRQMWDGKGSAEIDRMGPKRLRNYARHCGGALALAHARSGDGPAIWGYLGDDRTADHVLADFAAAYADLNVGDHAAHEQAILDGRVEVVELEATA